MTDSLNDNERKYIPPLVQANRLKVYVNYQNSINETNLDIGGYIRISTKKDSQITSIDNQKEILKEWAALNGYNIVRFYTDVKSGAYSYLRNEMQLLREDIKNGVIRGIAAKEISRTSRDIMDILELKRTLAAQGAFFLSLKESYDSRTDDDEFLLVIHAGLAQKERKTTASRVKVTQILKAKKGLTNVPSPAYGYKLSDDRQHLIVNPDTSKIYKLIIEKYLEGWGQLKICKYLNTEGIKAKRSDKWHTNSVRTILTNPVYLGITIYNATTLVRDMEGKQKRVVRPEEEWVIRHNTHEPLITEDLFNKVQDLVKEKKDKDTKEWSCDKKYLLSGFLYCDVCKGKIYGGKQVNKSRAGKVPGTFYTFFGYVDQNRYGVCNTKTKYWNMERVDECVMKEIKDFFQDKVLIEERIKAKQFLYNKNMVDDKEERQKFNITLSKVNNAIKRQQEAYENEAISIEEFKSRMNELREQKKDIAFKIDILNKKLNKVDNIEDRFNEIKGKLIKIIENIDKLDYNTKETILKKIIKRIYLRADYSINIEYMFEE